MKTEEKLIITITTIKNKKTKNMKYDFFFLMTFFPENVRKHILITIRSIKPERTGKWKTEKRKLKSFLQKGKKKFKFSIFFLRFH